MSSSDLPALYPLRLNGGRVGLLTLSEDDYRRASFLDDRLLEHHGPLSWRDWSDMGRTSSPRRAHFIFHTGHVGSTLLSRLLGEHPALFSVREPALLREVANERLHEEIGGLLGQFTRVWRPGQTALIKATSFVSAVGLELMDRTQGHAILLSTTPPNYLRTILGGPASRQEANALAPSRRDRLARRLNQAIEAESEGEVIAMSWLCEAVALSLLLQAYPTRCLWLDFDRLLAEPAAGLRLGFGHLGVNPQVIDLDALCSGPLMGRYAKAPEHAYDAELRRQVLDQAGREQALEVRRGMDWLQRMYALHPAVGAALQNAAAAARAPLAGDLPPVSKPSG